MSSLEARSYDKASIQIKMVLSTIVTEQFWRSIEKAAYVECTRKNAISMSPMQWIFFLNNSAFMHRARKQGKGERDDSIEHS